MWGKQELTPNAHALNHLPDTVENLGPLGENNLFIFEHKIGIIKSQIYSPTGVNQQIQEGTFQQLALELNGQDEAATDEELQPIRKSNRSHQRIPFRSSCLTTSASKNHFKDFYVKLVSGKYYRIEEIFEKDSLVYFKGQMIKLVRNLSFNYEVSGKVFDFAFEYIKIATQTTTTHEFSFADLDQKVVFQPESGFLIETPFVFHN